MSIRKAVFALLFDVLWCCLFADNDRFLYSFIRPKLQVTTCVHMSDHGLLASCFMNSF